MPERRAINRASLPDNQERDARDDKTGAQGKRKSAFTLYTSTQGNGVEFTHLFGVLDRRRVAAREAISMVLQRSEVQSRTTDLTANEVDSDP